MKGVFLSCSLTYFASENLEGSYRLFSMVFSYSLICVNFLFYPKLMYTKNILENIRTKKFHFWKLFL